MGGRNTGNGQGRSGQGDGPGRFSWPGKVAEMDPEVAQALLNLAQTPPAGFSVDEAKLTRRAEDYQNAQGTSKAKLRYLLLGDLYDKLVDLNAHREKQPPFVRMLQKEATIEWGVDFSLLLVQFYMKRPEAKATLRASALLERR
jgi:hypothetical protein